MNMPGRMAKAIGLARPLARLLKSHGGHPVAKATAPKNRSRIKEAMTDTEEYANARNPKHEKFAQLVASGMTAQAAFTQAGYPSPQNAPRHRNNALVAARIQELQKRKKKAELAA